MAPERKPITPELRALLSLPKPHPRSHNVRVATLNMYAYRPEYLLTFAHFAAHTAHSLGMPIQNPVSHKTTKSLYTVIKSSFVHKKSQENFELKYHKKSIAVYDSHPELVQLWLQYLRKNGPSGVNIRTEFHEYLELGVGRKLVEDVRAKYLAPVSENSNESSTQQTSESPLAQAASTVESAGSQVADMIKKQAESLKKTLAEDAINDKEMQSKDQGTQDAKSDVKAQPKPSAEIDPK